MKTDGKKWILRIVLTLSTAAFVCWIFSNSLKTAAESTVQSSFVKELVENFLSALVPGQGVEISEHVIRKLAHFCEYALLGFLLFFTYLSYTRKKLWFFIPSLVGIVIPFCDEGLQFFRTVGRLRSKMWESTYRERHSVFCARGRYILSF